MRARMIAVLALGLLAAACQQPAHPTAMTATPAGPSALEIASPALPFHSEIVWEKSMMEVPAGRCTRALPEGSVYLWVTHNTGTAVSTHLGAGPYENNLCVFGTIVDGKPAPAGWYADWIRWTAANGDVLFATSEFQRWTGVPGKSIAIDVVTFHDGGTGRFEYAEGEGMAYINAPERTGVYEGSLRYGKKDK